MNSPLLRSFRFRFVLLLAVMGSAAFGSLHFLFLAPPPPGPTVSGDYNLDGESDGADLGALARLIHDPDEWARMTGGTFADALAVGDYDGDGAITLADCQAFVQFVLVPLGSAPPDGGGAQTMGMGMLSGGTDGATDLDVDLDHTNPGFRYSDQPVLADRTEAEDLLEESGARRCLCMNTDDDDGSGFEDYADGSAVANETDLVPLAVEIVPEVPLGVPPDAVLWQERQYRLETDAAAADWLVLWPEPDRGGTALAWNAEYSHTLAVRGDVNFDGLLNFQDIPIYIGLVSDAEAWAADQLANNPDIPAGITLEFMIDLLDLTNDRAVTMADADALSGVARPHDVRAGVVVRGGSAAVGGRRAVPRGRDGGIGHDGRRRGGHGTGGRVGRRCARIAGLQWGAGELRQRQHPERVRGGLQRQLGGRRLRHPADGPGRGRVCVA
jgi:hypothetical protein